MSMYVVLYSINALLMIAMPVGLGWFIRRKRPVSWELFAIGGATFIFSQIGHIPFNYIVLRNWGDRLNALPEMTGLLVLAVFLGLSSGAFEEIARYLTYRFWASKARLWSRGVMLGAGHGGTEALIVGLLAAVNFFFIFSFRAGRLTRLIPEGQESQLKAVLDLLFTVPWYDTLLGAVERLFAMCLHLSLSLLVLQVFTRGRLRWLGAAILWHGLANGVAVVLIQIWGPYVAEGALALFAVLSLGIVWYFKEPEPVEPEPEPLPAVGPIEPLQLEITAEKLDESKFN